VVPVLIKVPIMPLDLALETLRQSLAWRKAMIDRPYPE